MQSATEALRAVLSLAGRRCAALALLGLLLGGAAQALGAEFSVTKEYQVKAAFLYNFTKFIDWPAQSFHDAGSPIIAGIHCPAEFAEALTNTVKDRKVNGRAIVVKRLEGSDQLDSVHLVFVCAVEDAQLAQLMPAAATRPLLTVGESASFAEAGGIINFVLDADKVRFEINIPSAERAGLKISSQLQKLAAKVHQAR